MTAPFATVTTSRVGRTALVIAALVVAFAADVMVGASWPGRIAVFALAASAALVFGAKALGSAFVSRPAGSRPGELGNPLDDLDGLDSLDGVDSLDGTDDA